MDQAADITHPGFQLTQLFVLSAVLVFFSLGLWCRGAIDHAERMTAKQFFALNVAGFILLALPLCPVVFNALIRTNNDLFIMIGALVPPFATGLTARREVERHF